MNDVSSRAIFVIIAVLRKILKCDHKQKNFTKCRFSRFIIPEQQTLSFCYHFFKNVRKMAKFMSVDYKDDLNFKNSFQNTSIDVNLTCYVMPLF